jgi:hypothetical protein
MLKTILILLLPLVLLPPLGCADKNKTLKSSACLPLLTSPLPKGITLSGKARAYGTAQNPQSHGTLYDFIDGGATLYLDKGCVLALRQGYGDAAGRALFAELYVMSGRDSALSLFNDPTLRTGDDTPIDIGEKGIVFHPAPDYIIEFFRQRFYVKVTATDDSAATGVEGLARMIDQNIKERKK